MAGSYNLDYWNARGVKNEDIFDTETGQIKPGWKRVKYGYVPESWPAELADNPPPDAPPYVPNTPISGDPNGGDWGYLTEPFTGTPPNYHALALGDFNFPSLTAPPPFSYPDFTPPTADSIYADPSYQFRKGEGEQSLQQSAAGRGVLRTGGTLKDVLNYGQNAASQEYSNIFNRGAQTYNMGLDKALSTYGVNWGTTKDVLNSEFNARKASYDAASHENDLMNQREFNNYLSNFDVFEKNRRRAGDYLTWAATQGGQ